MPDPSLQAVVPEAFARQHKPGPRRQHSLQGAMPRRYADHRTRAAKRYRQLYDEVVEAHPQRHALGRTLASMLADLLYDYSTLRLSKRKGARSARRKTTGLVMGLLREVKNASGHQGDDLAAELAKLTDAR